MIGYGKDLKGKGINTYHRSFNKTQTTVQKENPKYKTQFWHTPRRYFRKRRKVNYKRKEPRPRTVRERYTQKSIAGLTVRQAQLKTTVSQRYSQQKAAKEG